MHYYIDRRTKTIAAAIAGVVLIAGVSLGVALGLGGAPSAANTTSTTVPAHASTTVTRTTLPGAVAKRELNIQLRSLDQTLSRYPHPNTFPAGVLTYTIIRSGGQIVSNTLHGHTRLVVANFYIGGHTLRGCLTLGPTSASAKAC